MKKLLLLVTPPGIVILAKKASNHLRQLRKSAGRNAIASYNDDSLTEMVTEKNRVFSAELEKNKTIDLGAARTILGVCVSCDKGLGEAVTILDLGGGAGYHYFITRLVLDKRIRLNWRVVETESMVKAAGKLSNSELQFFPTIAAASAGIDRFDLIFASSSLQYIPTQFDVIDGMIATKARNIFVTRTPFSLDEPVYGVKQYSLFSSNGPGPLPAGYADSTIEYPIYIMNLGDFQKKFAGKYELRFKVREEVAGFTINGRPYDNYGFYFSAK
jgi:putative methyltransferase (TIGR04325 family)